MVLLGAFNALGRYLGRFLGTNLSSNAYIELQWYMFSLIFLLGAGLALKADSHVRVDVLFGRLGARARIWIDLLGTLFFLLPFCFFGLWVCWPSVANSWRVWEGSPDPGGLPRYPIKTVILLCFILLLLQGVSELIKGIARLRGELPLEEAEEPKTEAGL
ncbi:MAG: TRAP transporter small permease subunit [Acidobacteria bacterium]|nr:TRAP transporter small permease subunit [Acidobacteriota bacterium]